MARDEQDDPLNLKGSFAGAMGYGQFMPSSYKQYAVDFSGDGHITCGIRLMRSVAWRTISKRTAG